MNRLKNATKCGILRIIKREITGDEIPNSNAKSEKRG